MGVRKVRSVDRDETAGKVRVSYVGDGRDEYDLAVFLSLSMYEVLWEGAEVGEEAYHDADRRCRVAEARAEAVRRLAIGRRPSGRMEGILREGGYDGEVIAEVIKGLSEDGYLDDRAIALKELGVCKGKGLPAEAARERLGARGLCAEAVDWAMGEGGYDDREVAADYAKANIGLGRAKVAKRLMANGYDREAALGALDAPGGGEGVGGGLGGEEG
ncbi:MAG: RecX family transcriptional regulator [Oscillospiraceae bacterium]|nr:RecX family transcriptional regulator [Oscillospiraceae bacterium]